MKYGNMTIGNEDDTIEVILEVDGSFICHQLKESDFFIKEMRNKALREYERYLEDQLRDIRS